jgi:hypothetical protein
MMQKKYGLIDVDGNESIEDIYHNIQTKISGYLDQNKKNETLFR